jgi:hypothetical protein
VFFELIEFGYPSRNYILLTEVMILGRNCPNTLTNLKDSLTNYLHVLYTTYLISGQNQRVLESHSAGTLEVAACFLLDGVKGQFSSWGKTGQIWNWFLM